METVTVDRLVIPSHCVLLERNSTYQIFSPYHLPNINDGIQGGYLVPTLSVGVYVPSAITYILDQRGLMFRGDKRSAKCYLYFRFINLTSIETPANQSAGAIPCTKND
jgi:hypothetical protein